MGTKKEFNFLGNREVRGGKGRFLKTGGNPNPPQPPPHPPPRGSFFFLRLGVFFLGSEGQTEKEKTLLGAFFFLGLRGP